MALRINWPGRIAVGPTMFGIWLALLGVRDVGEGFVYAGIALALVATGYYSATGCASAAESQAQLDPLACAAILALTRPRPKDAAMDETFPDLGTLTDKELKELIDQLSKEEQEVSYRRRLLHGKIDILRAELVNRLRGKHAGGEDIFSGSDVERLTEILAGRAAPPPEPDAE